MGFLIPFTMFGIAVGAILVWGLRDKARQKAARASGDVHPRQVA